MNQGVELKASVITESFSIYLRTRYRSQYFQFDKQQQGLGNHAFQAQYQMMMNMFMMSMYQNPQGQNAMMQFLATQGGAGFPGGPGSITNSRNLYVRKAKGKTDEATSDTGSGSHSARGKGGRDWESKEPRNAAYQHSNKKEKKSYGGNSSSGNERKIVDKEIEPIGRTRLDSDSFPPISGTKKQIPTEGLIKTGGRCCLKD